MRATLPELLQSYWSLTPDALLGALQTSPLGLPQGEIASRRRKSAKHRSAQSRFRTDLHLLVSQFTTPMVLLLISAAAISAFLSDPLDASIILTIVVASGMIGFWQERRATQAVAALLSVVQTKASVYRGGVHSEIPIEEVVSGDIVLLSTGDIIPADCVVIEATDLSVNQASLTGESIPVEKVPGPVPADTRLSERSNALYMGTYVTNGTARAVAVRVGTHTEFGAISLTLTRIPLEPEFERGIRQFSYLLVELTFALTLIIFCANVILDRTPLESLLFALALAVGLTPQLLPGIISVNLAHGAARMAEKKVIIKRPSSIEDFGSIDVLCSDKTGTLTEGVVSVHSALDFAGTPDDTVLLYATINASLQSAYHNPIDEAITRYRSLDLTAYTKLDEVPYDFIRKRLSVLVRHGDQTLMVTKGAFASVLDVCSFVQTTAGPADIEPYRAEILARYQRFSEEGLRTLGVAIASPDTQNISKANEQELTFLGFILTEDPLRPEAKDAVERLRALGISLKLLTGDNRIVAARVASLTGIPIEEALTGADVQHLEDEALAERASKASLFSELEPHQKERIILALKRSGHVVGYIGDGINDASALFTSDVGISVANAVDVAREAAEVVLLEKDLRVLEDGIREGRRTFANTLKYVFMATSANFGNMFSMAGASLFLPFLPLLPLQILLTNLLTDLPEMAIATDTVDDELVRSPQRWDIASIRRFMLSFGFVSSLFDYLTFFVLLVILRASPTEFRTGWFVESVISASLIVLVVRTRKPIVRSFPSRPLMIATLAVLGITIALPFSPIGPLFGLVALPYIYLPMLVAIVVGYIFAAEGMKRVYYRTRRHTG